jgi:hypothetical protein
MSLPRTFSPPIQPQSAIRKIHIKDNMWAQDFTSETFRLLPAAQTIGQRMG